ncbi:MAG: NAD(P)-dependent glycerol-3-phosphate dehydrogenase [Eubacteriales bacterium]|jgi:glycerol-3-phosphate dehydrogenase (NAD(P)+)|nr:NAD(P)-dependent glycerol-3-phosphate dehydrogenase [Eubacteriales bacterium]
MSKVAMIGCGAWGMALACHLSRSGHDVTVWCHSEEAAAKLTAERKMEAAFPGIQFPENIVFTHDAELAATGRDLIVFSVASSFTRSTAKLFAPFIPEGQKVVTVTKGIENETFKLQTEIIESEIPGITCAALSGPTHAEEVIRDMPTAIVAAAADRETAEFVQDIFISPFFRVYTSPDVRGVELGGSLKNVIALAAGMADGMGFGDNCKAALMTRGIHEIAGTAVKLGADVRTLTGLSGIGDLIVTCGSVHSRNHRCGELIGRGMTPREAIQEVGQVVEGFYCAKAAAGLAKKCGTSMPITEEVNRVLFEGRDPKAAVTELMLRGRKMEADIPEDKLPEGWR